MMIKSQSKKIGIILQYKIYEILRISYKFDVLFLDNFSSFIISTEQVTTRATVIENYF